MQPSLHPSNLRPTLPRMTARLAVSVILVVVAAALAIGWLVLSKSQGTDALSETSILRKTQVSELTESLTRTGITGEGTEVDVILTTPDFFRLTRRTEDATAYGADQFVVFVANETVHSGDLPKQFAPFIRVNGDSVFIPTEVRVLTDAEHHRTSVIIFEDLPAELLDTQNQFEMVLPASADGSRQTLSWLSPIDYPDSIQKPQALTFGLLLSLAAGLMAVIAPCLLQLTAFYLPMLAGVSIAQSEGTTTRQQRRKVIGTALLFILGFTIPYTLGGALMGGIGEQLAESNLLDQEGPLVIGAGLVMIAMAGVVAYRAHAPLACKVPVPGRIRRSRRLPLLTPFISGFAMATGCLACFGGAILGVLLVYAGMLGSPLLGGLAMFVFSMGIAIPFLAAAISISWVMPIAMRLSSLTRVIGTISALIMLAFGVIMASGNFHIVSGWLSRSLPLA